MNVWSKFIFDRGHPMFDIYSPLLLKEHVALDRSSFEKHL